MWYTTITSKFKVFYERGVFMKYVCQICGFTYDEEAEGVKWEDLGDDYACPLCSVDKSNFSEEE